MSQLARPLVAAIALIGALALPACDALDSFKDSSSDKLPDLASITDGDLASHFSTMVDEFFSARGIQLPDDVNQQLQKFIQQGVDTLKSSELVQSSLTQAEANLTTFLEQLLDGSGFDGVGEFTTSTEIFDKVKAQVCPLYPFC